MEFMPKRAWKEWDYNGAMKKGKVSRAGTFENEQGLSIAFYSWEVPNPTGVVIFSHGHGVHATFELLTSVKSPGIRTSYNGTWVKSFNDAGFSVFALDHQGCGRSDYARGKRSFFERIDHLVNDFSRIVRLVRDEVGPELPTFLLGMSMGGYVVVNAAINDETIADGVALLAPMLSLNKLASKGINRVLLPLLTVISRFLPTLPMAETARNTKFPHSQREVEMDSLTWPSGVKRTRARVAAEYYLGTQRIQKRLHEMNVPFIVFHGRDDPMTDPESSEMLYQRAASSDKSLQWVDNVFHDLMHEKPTSARVCAAITDWFLTRSDRTKPKAKSSARGGAK
jgi:alpha-beta hydrolase superfamily lysophospholipase